MPFLILLLTSTQGGVDVAGNQQHRSAPAENDAKPQLTLPGVASEALCTEAKGRRICSSTLSKGHNSKKNPANFRIRCMKVFNISPEYRWKWGGFQGI